MGLKLGGQDYRLTGADYAFKAQQGCQLCVQGSKNDFWILGDVLHRKYAVTYDFGSQPPRVGLPINRPGTSLPVPGMSALSGLLAMAIASFVFVVPLLLYQTMKSRGRPVRAVQRAQPREQELSEAVRQPPRETF